MSDVIRLHYDVDGENFHLGRRGFGQRKKQLRQMGFPPEVIRRVSIAMYEGEINMVIHAGGGQADVAVAPDKIEITLTDHGPGIADISLP